MFERRRLSSALSASAIAGCDPTMIVTPSSASGSMTLALGGDVMLGRRIDQSLATLCDPACMNRWFGPPKRMSRLPSARMVPPPKPVDAAYVAWLPDRLDCVSAPLGMRVSSGENERLPLQ